MARFRTITFCLGSLAWFVSSAFGQDLPAVAPPGREIWRHNDSAVYLVSKPKQMSFRYQEARYPLKQYVKTDTLLLEVNEDDSGRYSGKAYHFSQKCGSIDYPIKETAKDRYTLEFRGQAPVRDSACKVTGARDDVLLFTFVFRVPNEPQKSSTSPIYAGPLKAAILANPKAAMEVVSTFSTPASNETAESIVSAVLNGGIWVSTCLYSSDFLNDERNSENNFIGWYFLIAKYYARAAAEMKTVGYPNDIWEKPLGAVRDKMLAEIIQQKAAKSWSGFGYSRFRAIAAREERDLIQALDSYASTRAPHLIRARGEARCGGDFWGHFGVRLEPKEGKVWFIDDFHYTWCKKAGYDPTQRTNCDFWVLLLPKQSLPFGTYQYRVEWADGSTEADRIDVGDAGQDGQTITIRKLRQ